METKPSLLDYINSLDYEITDTYKHQSIFSKGLVLTYCWLRVNDIDYIFSESKSGYVLTKVVGLNKEQMIKMTQSANVMKKALAGLKDIRLS